MFSRVLAVWVCLFALGGCIYNEEPMPQITQSGVAPVVVKQTEAPTDIYKDIPRDWLPPSWMERKWTAIVVHHSDTANGNASMFDRFHKEGRHWQGVGYDFVIGNGTNSGDGQVEVTYRWRGQKIGAHCGGTPGNWANREAVGICLVGNFNRTVPSVSQMQSLEKLIRFLQRRYKIPRSRIYGHGVTPGYKGKTKCPGRKFPMARLKSKLDF